MEKSKKISVLAPAKINLYLGVRSRRADGYHDIESVMQTIDLCDKVTVSAQESPTGSQIFVHCRGMENIEGENNIAYRAAKVFFDHTKIEKYGVSIEIDKKIPSEAGLGGGSSDAAATLRALDELYGTKLTESELCALGARVGADVPFLLRRGTAYVEGIGEILSDCTPSPCATLLVAYPNEEKVCTKEAYAKIDEAHAFSKSEDFEKMKEAMRSCNIHRIAEASLNIFESVIAPDSAVFRIKDVMKKNGALLALMSGSGSAVFGVFEDARAAKRAREALCEEAQTFISGMFTRDETYIEN